MTITNIQLKLVMLFTFYYFETNIWAQIIILFDNFLKLDLGFLHGNLLRKSEGLVESEEQR